MDKKTIYMHKLLAIIEFFIGSNENRFKYLLLNKLGFRLILTDKEFFISFCIAMEETKEYAESVFNEGGDWVYDPDIKPGTYQDAIDGCMRIGYGVGLKRVN